MGKTSIRRVAAVVLALTLVSSLALAGGCIGKSSLQKMDLAGQLKRINKEVHGLNDQTVSLVEVIGALDQKESQLNDTVSLLKSVNGGAQTQISTIEELTGIVGSQRTKVSGVLGVAGQVLSSESALKGNTEAQLNMTGQTLDLVKALFRNLTNFKSVNDNINNKMDRALGIMRNM